LYIVIAVLVITSGRAEDPGGALEYLGSGSAKWLLALITLGFIAYGLWRLSDAAFNIEQHGPGVKGARERLGAAGSGIVHLVLAWQAVRLMRGAPGSDSSGNAIPIDGSGTILAIAGVVLLSVGIFQLVKGANATFCKKLDGRVASQAWVKTTGQLGYAARGCVFMITGYFFVSAALTASGAPTGGMDRALSWLSDPWDVLVAVGLLLFGVFSLVEARYRRIHQLPVGAVAGHVRNRVEAKLQ
jgi:hypothetical protein